MHIFDTHLIIPHNGGGSKKVGEPPSAAHSSAPVVRCELGGLLLLASSGFRLCGQVPAACSPVVHAFVLPPKVALKERACVGPVVVRAAPHDVVHRGLEGSPREVVKEQ